MKQHWPDDDVMVKLLSMYKEHTDAGVIQYMYGTAGKSSVPAEAFAKGSMAIMETNLALAVDVVNGVIFASAGIFEYAIGSGNEQLFTSIGFKDLFDLLKSQGLPARVIEIRKNGSIKYLD